MSVTNNEVLDQNMSEQFAEKMMSVLNHGALTVMTSIGHRTGLFDVMAELPPSGSAEIAYKAGLNERYVREWLGAMVTGGIVRYNESDNTFHLPHEHAAWLTRKAAPNNLAVGMQWFSVLGSVEDDIIECFRNGGGVPYEKYKRFHEVMSEESRQTVIVPLVDELLPLAPGLVDKLEEGIDVLDVGCGSGFAVVEMAKRFPRSSFLGYDLSEEAISRGRNLIKENNLYNARLEVKDASDFNAEKKFDLITTFDAIHDQAKPDVVLRNIHSSLRDDGIYFMQDIAGSSHIHKNMDHPVAPFLYTISCMHCMTVSLAQNGQGLGAMWGRELACKMLEEAGFTQIEVKELPHDPLNYYYVIKK